MGRLKDLFLFQIKYQGKERYLIALYYFLISLGFMYGAYWFFENAVGLTYSFLFASVLMLSLCFAYVWDIVRHNLGKLEVIGDVVFGFVYVVLFLLLFSLAKLHIRPSILEVLVTIVLFYFGVAMSDDFIKFFRKFMVPQILVLPIPPINIAQIDPTKIIPTVFSHPFYILVALVIGYFLIKLLKYVVRIAIAVVFIWLIAKSLGII